MWAAAGTAFGRDVLARSSWFGQAVYHPAYMLSAFMEDCTYEAAWWVVSTGLEAVMAQLAAIFYRLQIRFFLSTNLLRLSASILIPAMTIETSINAF